LNFKSRLNLSGAKPLVTEYHKKRDLKAASIATLFLCLFLVVCIIIDYQEINSHYLMWIRFTENCLSVYWPNNPQLFQFALPFSTTFDTMIPLIPLTVLIVTVNQIGKYLELNPFQVFGHRIHHYHLGIILSLIGFFLTLLNGGAETVFLNGKETTTLEISQGLGLCLFIAGIIFIILDSDDFKNGQGKSLIKYLKSKWFRRVN